MTPLRANGFLLLAALFWGAGNVPQKTVLDDLEPFTAVGLRCLIGVLVVLPFVWREAARQGLPQRAELRCLLEVALLFAVAITIQQWAYATTSVTNASFLISTTTVITPLVVWLLLRKRPAPMVWIAVTSAFVGAIMMSGGGVSSFALGDFACLVSALFYSIWFVRLGSLVCRTGRPGVVIIVQFSLTGILCLGFGAAMESINAARLEAAMPELLLLGIIGTGVPYGLQAMAQQYATASTAAVLTSAESVFGAVAAVIFLGEWLTPGMLAGASFVLIAIFTIHFASQTVPPKSENHA